MRVKVAYDGTHLIGSQRQGEKRTVQGELERVAEGIFQKPVSIYLAGRTDRGVHASGQVASFADPRPAMVGPVMQSAFNAHLPEDIAIVGCQRMPVGFHARYSATAREYRYRIWSGIRNPLAEPYVWRIRSKLDVIAMNTSAQVFVGEHDFASLASGGEGVPESAKEKDGKSGTVRTVFDCSCEQVKPWWGSDPVEGELHEIRIVANGFLPRMVRGIVGVLAEVGRGNWSVDDVEQLLAARDRRKGPMNAPAKGLTLWSVRYEEN